MPVARNPRLKMPRARWIPKVGEHVTLMGYHQPDGRRGLIRWDGFVESVTKRECKPGTVYLKLRDLGFTTASKEEIIINTMR